MLNDREGNNGKKIMEEKLEKVNRVWSTFCKYLTAHCVKKEKTVDTTLIGMFIPCEGKISYMPLPDFVTAGKFKLQRSAQHVDLNVSLDTSAIISSY